jgi:sulfate permease, SulP family
MTRFGSVRHAVWEWLRSVGPQRRYLGRDLLAGLPGAVSSVPDGMAAAILVGVNPVQGLYASFAGPIAGGLAANTRLMVITTTSASALAAGSALSAAPAAQRPAAVPLVAIIAGAALVAAGLFKLGRYTRFVSYSVMTGFLTGVAVNIVCGQIPDLTGAKAQGAFPLAKALNVLIRPGTINVASLLTGLGALATLVVMSFTPWRAVSALVALVVPTVAVALAGAATVARVGDEGHIPPGIPPPHLPDFGLVSFSLVTGALAVAAIVFVQGAGVAEAAPNENGQPQPNTDIIAQGAGNLVSGFFRGLPVGGSVGQTALNKSAGARTRWAAIYSGVWMLVILAALSPLVAKVAVPTLAGVLIFAAAGALRVGEIRTIMRSGRIAQIAVTSTFLATLFLSVAAAIGIGVALSLLLQLDRGARDLSVVDLVPAGGGRYRERPAPASLPSNQVTILDVYGSMLYAGSRTLQALLPDPAGSHAPAVVLRLRGRTTLGATFLKVIAGYAERLAEVDGQLYLSGLDAGVAERLRRTGRLNGLVGIFEATPLIGESTEVARHAAQTWLVRNRSAEDAPPSNRLSNGSPG